MKEENSQKNFSLVKIDKAGDLIETSVKTIGVLARFFNQFIIWKIGPGKESCYVSVRKRLWMTWK